MKELIQKREYMKKYYKSRCGNCNHKRSAHIYRVCTILGCKCLSFEKLKGGLKDGKGKRNEL